MHAVLKHSIIGGWGIATSLFLWYFIIIPEPGVGVFQYFNFCIVLFGGGVAYHVVASLSMCPCDVSNAKEWKVIGFKIFLVLCSLFFSGFSVALGLGLGGGVGITFAMVGMAAGMLLALYFLMVLRKLITELVAGN